MIVKHSASAKPFVGISVWQGKPRCLCTGQVLLPVVAFLCAMGLSAQHAAAQTSWILPNQTAEPLQANGGISWTLPSKPAYTRNAAGREVIDATDRPEVPLFAYGTTVTTGFPGVISKEPYVYADGRTVPAEALALDFIDPNGASAVLLAMDGIGFGYDASEVTRPAYDKILARDVGMVFGIAIDQEEYRNLYLAATSAFGLNVVGGDLNNDRVADRLKTGAAEAVWMPAQWGNDPAAGPGSIWRVDGRTGQIELFANIGLNGVANAGASLGDLTFDAGHDQLFVSDLETGLIHRLDLDGTDLEHFDHGTMARALAGLLPVADDPATRMDLTSPNFNAEDSATWGFAPLERRVGGMAVQAGRLYYAVADGPQIWSVGLLRDGAFDLTDVRWELDVVGDMPASEISDMVFDGAGAMVLAQRGNRRGDFSHQAFATSGQSAVLRYVYEDPIDPDTPSAWVSAPHVYAVGFAEQETNTTGGVDVGPGYDLTGSWDQYDCRGTLWSTGEKLRENAELSDNLELGGEALIDGIQAQPVSFGTDRNSPPWQSYFSDYDGLYPTKTSLGHIGDVEVLGCVGGVLRPAGGDDLFDDDDRLTGDDRGPDSGDDTATNDGDDPKCRRKGGCRPTQPPACLDAFVKPICNQKTGTYEAITLFTDKTGEIDSLKLTDTSGAMSPVPGEIAVDDILTLDLARLAKGQQAQLNVCGFNAKGRASGKPYDCCTVNLVFKRPNSACEKGAN